MDNNAVDVSTEFAQESTATIPISATKHPEQPKSSNTYITKYYCFSVLKGMLVKLQAMGVINFVSQFSVIIIYLYDFFLFSALVIIVYLLERDFSYTSERTKKLSAAAFVSHTPSNAFLCV